MLEIMFFALFDCLYVIESFKKIREIAGFIPNPLRFHEKNFWEAELTGAGKNRGFLEHCAL